ncbi:carbohydrate ABC transporter substrate-binding protein [Bacillus sp. FJAT-50079]|nr:carbohydrate ABC transporter substrate-binding protein [Bacillus sp. FJAT-50079]
MKKWLITSLFIFFLFSLAACSGGESTGSEAPKDEGNGGEKTPAEKTTLHVAALESAYGAEMWSKIAESFEAANENVIVKLTVEKNLEEVIRPNMQAGEYPDVVLLATGREEALTETLIKENGVEKITDVLGMKVYGEDGAVSEKMLSGFTDTLATNPYADGETYLGPMFYSPTGLFYNAGIFEEKGWTVPETWDEMWELGEAAAKDGISLFTYPTTGYFDTLVGSMLYAAGGPDFYQAAMTYEDGIWESKEATQVFETVGKLADYTHPNTVANANPNDFTKNQQLILDNKALFMPNGTWVAGEMAEAPRAENFEWAMMPVPAFEKGGDRYAFTFFEQIWIPSEAKNKDIAKEFITYMYSDKAASIFLEANAVQPIEGITDQLDGQNEVFYQIYEEGALPAMGTFASTKPVPGVSMGDTLYGQVDSVMSGKLSVDKWQASIEEASDKLRPALN